MMLIIIIVVTLVVLVTLFFEALFFKNGSPQELRIQELGLLLGVRGLILLRLCLPCCRFGVRGLGSITM